MTKHLQLLFLFLLLGFTKSWAIVGDSCSNPAVANLCGNGFFKDTTDSYIYNPQSWNVGGQNTYTDGQVIYYQINLPVSSYQPVSLQASLAGYNPNCNGTGCNNAIYFFWYENSPCSSNPIAVSSYIISGTSTTQDSILTSYTINNVQSQYYLVIAFAGDDDDYQYNLQLGFTNNQPLPTPTCSPAPPPYKGLLTQDRSMCYTSSNPYQLPLSDFNENPADSNLLFPLTLNQHLKYLPINDNSGNGFILTIKTEDDHVNFNQKFQSFDQFPYTYSQGNFTYYVGITAFFNNSSGISGLKGFRIQVPLGNYGNEYTYPSGKGFYDTTGDWVVTYNPDSLTYTWLFRGKGGRGDNTDNNGYSCKVYTFVGEFSNLGNNINAWYLPDNYGNDSVECVYGASNPPRVDCGNLPGYNYNVQQGWIALTTGGAGGSGITGESCGSDQFVDAGPQFVPCNPNSYYSTITYDSNGCQVETDYLYDLYGPDFTFSDYNLYNTPLATDYGAICSGKPYQLALSGGYFLYNSYTPSVLVYYDSTSRVYHPVDSLGNILYSISIRGYSSIPQGDIPTYPSNQNNFLFTVPLSVKGLYTIIYTENYYSSNDTIYYNPSNCQPGRIIIVEDTSPKVVLSPSSDTTICRGEILPIIESGAGEVYSYGGGATYKWYPDSTVESYYYYNNNNEVGAKPHVSTTYTVIGIDYRGCTDTVNYTININICPPVADFGFYQYTCSSDTAVIYNQSWLGPTSWQWSFPGGTPSSFTGENPPYIKYPAVGAYPVKLVVSNNVGRDSVVNYIEVGTCIPLAVPAVSDTVICQNGCVTFTNLSPFFYGFSAWTFPGGTPSTARDYDNYFSSYNEPVTVCYPAIGFFAAQLITSDYTYSDTAYITIHVTNCHPVAGFTYPDTLFCNSKCATFTNTSTGKPISYYWNFEGGSPASYSGSTPPAVCYSIPGNYTISLIVSDSTTSDTSIHTITIGSCPLVTSIMVPDTVCATQCITVNDSSVNTSLWQWSFPGGSPSFFSGNTPPAICYSVPGNDTITLIVSNNFGSNTVSKIIEVKNCFPHASFAAVDSICRNGCIAVTNNSSANCTSWQWLFTGGIPGSFTGQNPSTVCYDRVGTYIIRLIAANSISSDTLVKTIQVNACQPTASFSVNNDIICRTNCVTLTNTSVNATTWQWNFAGGTPSSYSGQNPPNVCYSTAGSYTIQLIVSNVSASDTLVKNILVNDCLPTAGFSINNDTTCITNCLTITNTSVNANSWNWSFPGGTPSSHIGKTLPNICYSTPGTFPITLIVSNVYGNDTATSTVVVNDCSLPKAAISEKDTICATDCIAIIADSVNNVSTWSWNFPGGTPSTYSGQTPPNICYSSVGKYTTQLIVTNNYGADTIYHTLVVINCIPHAAFAGKDSICPGDCITFTNASSANATNWQWVFNGGTPATYSGQNPPQVCFSALGNYAVQLIALNNYGSDTATQNITVFKYSAGNIATSLDTICEGNSALLNLQNSWGAIQWQASDTTFNFTNISGATSGSYQFSSVAQTTYVRVIAGSGNCADTSDIVKLSVLPPLSGIFTWSVVRQTVSFAFHDSSGTALTYSWNFGDGDTASILANPVHVYGTTDTTLYACLTIRDGTNCSYTFCQYIAVGTTGVAGVSASSGINIYPNPAQDELTVDALNNFTPQQIALVDALGRTLLQTTPAKSSTVLNVHTYAAGIYFVKIHMNDGSVEVRKFVKE